jgi:hypothetical protein
MGGSEWELLPHLGRKEGKWGNWKIGDGNVAE